MTFTKLKMREKKCLKKKNFKPFLIPKFDKSIDDRFKKKNGRGLINLQILLFLKGGA